MWFFNKKPAEVIIEVVDYSKQPEYEIPCEHLPEIIQLYDDVVRKNTKMTKFLLWKRIEEIIPSVKAEPTARWVIRFKTSTNVVIYVKPEVQNARK